MVDRLKDSEDLKLEALFRSEPVADNGFSERIVKRVRRRMWVQRLTLPTAIGIGAIIAAKPVAQLVILVPRIISSIPLDRISFVDLPLEGLIQGPAIFLGGILLAAMLMVGRMLEE
jgi:hypothetical protein